MNRAGGAQRVDQQARYRHLADAPGHRRDRARDIRHLGKGDIADQTGLAVFVLQPVDADIDHGSARFDPVAAYHFGLADGGIDKVGPGAQSREIARTGMRNRHRRIFIEQQLHQGTADQIGAADHDGVHAFQRRMHAFGEDDATKRRAWRERGKSAGQSPGVVGMQPVDVLGGIDGVDDRFGMQRFRQRQLHQNAVDARIAIELSDQRQQIALCDIGREHVLERCHAGCLRLLVLAADVELAGGIAADQHHREPGCYPVLALHPRDLTGDAGAKLGGNDFSIDDPGRHLNPFCRSINPRRQRSLFATPRPTLPDRRQPRSA